MGPGATPKMSDFALLNTEHVGILWSNGNGASACQQQCIRSKNNHSCIQQMGFCKIGLLQNKDCGGCWLSEKLAWLRSDIFPQHSSAVLGA